MIESVIYAQVLSLTCLFVHSVRLSLLIPISIPKRSLFLSTSYNFCAALFFPAKINEIVRYLYLNRLYGVPAKDYIFAIFGIQCVDGLLLLATGVALTYGVGTQLLEGFDLDGAFVFGVALLIGLVLLVLCFLVKSERVYSLAVRALHTFRWRSFSASLIGGALTWVLTFGVVWCGLHASGIQVSWQMSYAVLFAIMLAGVAPMLPGAAGTFEALVVAALASFDVALLSALKAALYVRVLLYSTPVLISVFLGGRDLAGIIKTAYRQNIDKLN